METKDFIIGVDMDDILENFLDAWVEWLNEKYNLSVNSNEMDEWETIKFFPSLTPQQVYAPLYDDEFWKTVQPKKGAQEYLKKLTDEGFTIFIVTCSHYASIKAKVENCLLKYFPYLDWRQIITLRYKQMLNLNVLIDDYQNNLIDAPYKGILLDRPYNRFFKEDGVNIKRVYNWDEIYNEIHKLYNQIGD